MNAAKLAVRYRARSRARARSRQLVIRERSEQSSYCWGGSLPLNRNFLHCNIRYWPIAPVRGRFTDAFNDVHTAYDLAENSVLSVQMGRRPERDEELRSAGVGTGIRHRQNAGAVVAQLLVEFV